RRRRLVGPWHERFGRCRRLCERGLPTRRRCRPVGKSNHTHTLTPSCGFGWRIKRWRFVRVSGRWFCRRLRVRWRRRQRAGRVSGRSNCLSGRSNCLSGRSNLHLPSITIPQLDLHAWSQALHGNHGVGLGFGLRGLAGNALLNPSPLARQGGALAGPARPSGNPFADLSRGGHAGLGAGIAAPAPGRAGFALAALADQAAANIADTRPTLDGATLHVGDAVLTAGSAAGAVGDNSVTNRLPGLTLTTLSLDPNNPGQQTFTSSTFQNSQSGTRTWGDLARPNGLAQHLVAAPARVHDPETFDDGTTGDSTFTLHAEGDDANGHFILDESGSTHTVWNEWGDDTSDHWTLDETGSFTATFHYVGQDPTTTTIPIDVHQSSDAEESPAGFDLEAYNQTLFYSTDSITVWDIDADGSETYHAHVQ